MGSPMLINSHSSSQQHAGHHHTYSPLIKTKGRNYFLHLKYVLECLAVEWTNHRQDDFRQLRDARIRFRFDFGGRDDRRCFVSFRHKSHLSVGRSRMNPRRQRCRSPSRRVCANNRPNYQSRICLYSLLHKLTDI